MAHLYDIEYVKLNKTINKSKQLTFYKFILKVTTRNVLRCQLQILKFSVIIIQKSSRSHMLKVVTLFKIKYCKPVILLVLKKKYI